MDANPWHGFSRYENQCYHARLTGDRQDRMLKNRGLDLVVAGNLVLPGDRLVAGEIGIRDGRIAAIADSGALRAERRIEAQGLVLPGVVDAHVHTRSEPAEGITKATTAAAAGGVTTIVDMPYDDPTPITTEPAGRALELALATGVRVHIVHATVERTFKLVARARDDGVDASAETCLHYLLMDEEELLRQGARAKINPPLRTSHDVERLWQLLEERRIAYVTTDHVGWTRERKTTKSIFDAKSGVPALEVFLPLFFDAAVGRRDFSVGRLAELLSENPARRMGLWPQKGGIAIGADADLVLFDPDRRWRIDEERLLTPAGWSPYHGREVTGAIDTGLVRGETVFDRGQLTGTPGRGRWVRPDQTVATVGVA